MNSRQSSPQSSDWSMPSTASDATGSSRSRRSRRDKKKARRQASRRLTMEDLEKRQLLAANPLGPIPGADDYDGPRNIGTVSALRYREQEAAQITGLNDFFQDAEFVPLGNLPGQRDTIDITGAARFQQFGTRFISDVDFYSFDLKAGDILDIATLGASTSFDVFLPNQATGQASGRLWFGQDDAVALYPVDSPLQNSGVVDVIGANAAQVVPFDGRYSIAVSAEGLIGSNYTIGLRTYRPVTESLPIGQGQIIFLDFDGGSFARDEFNDSFEEPGIPVGGRFRIPDISQTLDDAGVVVRNFNEYQRIAERITQAVEEQFADIGVYGANGSFAATGIPGSYGITILNSLEHPDPGSNPLVTRVVFGSEESFEGIEPSLGLAQSIDVGNFDLSELVLVWVDQEVLAVEGLETSAFFSFIDVLGLEIGVTTTHEIAHVLGLYHTNGGNLIPSIIDGAGDNDLNGLGVGPDGILGTFDDELVRFRTDAVDPGGAITFGTLFSDFSISLTLATGTRGGGLTGRVFNDLNGDGNGAGDPGLSGVRVFIDSNRNGALDPSEPNTTSNADGSYSLVAAANDSANPNYSVVAISPPTATTSRSVSVSSNGLLSNSGNSTAQPIAAGSTVFVDYDSDGFQDFNEPSDVVDNVGVYVMTGVLPGLQTLLIQSPGNFAATTASSQTVVLGNAGGVGPTFGFGQINPDVTGKKYADLNNNGLFDIGEPGVEGAYIYADLDNDNRPDLGEPFTHTDANGNYKLDLPILGRPFAIREVEEPGFIRTEPNNPEGEWVVNYTGTPLGSFYNFGGLPSRDYGDAPDSYRTTIGAGGPSHGTLDGMFIGFGVDRESNGQPSANATGDDLNGSFDDEDGVVNSVPLRPGATGIIDVTLTNTTGSAAYLQAWLDLNADGDFLDAGEQIRSDAVLGTGTHSISVSLPTNFDINADGTLDGILNTFARFRYSITPGLGVGGGADTGEVEDHVIRILAAGTSGNQVTDDFVNVPQNSSAFRVRVLDNDFDVPSNPLTITSVSRSARNVQPIIGVDPATGKQVILYSPPRNYTGPDSFRYTVVDANGETAEATVFANVQFATAAPIAIDDLFEVASNQTNVPLNVLDNDIASVGGLTIAQVSRGTQGGTLVPVPGERGVRYTPIDGFVGTEQFSYTITDGTGATSSAIGTVVLTPQSFANDKASFQIQLLDKNNDTELLSLQSGQEFRMRVLVDDIFRSNATAVQGLQSAFTDLLYTAELVTPTDNNTTDAFPFDITFGPRFETPSNFQSGLDQKPGLIDEVGSTQSLADLLTVGLTSDRASFQGFEELFTITMRANGTGLATFKTDPTENAASETVLIDTSIPIELDFDEITYGSRSIEILPAGDGFPVALDDSFPVGLDSPGQTIQSGVPARLNVLTNDLVGNDEVITEFVLREAPVNGTAVRVEAGPVGPAGDYFAYTPQSGFSGFDRFSYILTVQSPTFGTVRSIAEVTLTVGQVQDPLVSFDFTVVNEAGNAIPGGRVPIGQRFGVRIDAIDLGSGRPPSEAVFAGFLDVLYNSNILSTIAVDNGGNPNVFDFDVEFDPQFLLTSAVGTNDRPGLIDEFGSNQGNLGGDGITLATVYFRGLRQGTATVTGSPADRFPFQDTLLDENDAAVPVSNIQFDSITVTIVGSGEPIQNPSLPQDVNDDNLVTAIDALIVINEMARREANGESASNEGSQFYLDVNGDGFVTAVDALQVINRLNDQGPSGEQIAPAPVQRVDNPDENPTDQLIADLAADVKIIGQSDADIDSAVLVDGTHSAAADSDSEDDDLLSLLADDIANQWKG